MVMKRIVLISSALAILSGALAAGASASTWTASKLPDPEIRIAFYGVDCPTTLLCVAVGGNNTIATTREPTGGVGAWTVGRYGGGVENLAPPGSGSITYPGGQIRGVSCPTAGLCVAAGFEGSIYTSTDPANFASWRAYRLTPPKTPNIHMGGISCPSPSLCVVVAYGGKVATSTDPGVEGSWTVTDLGGNFDLRGISCASVALCVAVGNEGNILASTDPTGGPSAWSSAGAPVGEESLNGVDCPTTALCVTGGAGKIITSTDPAGGAGAWQALSAGSGLPLKDVSCISVSACVGIDNNADVMPSTEPTGGASAWPFKNVLKFDSPGPSFGNGMFGISCAGVTLCAAVGQDSQVVVSADPFTPDPLAPSARGRSKRPHVAITKHPARRVDSRQGGVKVTFRFRAIGKARGLRCKLDRRHFAPCHSPRRYRAHTGTHVFKVRAIGLTGARGPVTSFQFRVGGLAETPSPGSCPDVPKPGVPCVNARP